MQTQIHTHTHIYTQTARPEETEEDTGGIPARARGCGGVDLKRRLAYTNNSHVPFPHNEPYISAKETYLSDANTHVPSPVSDTHTHARARARDGDGEKGTPTAGQLQYPQQLLQHASQNLQHLQYLPQQHLEVSGVGVGVMEVICPEASLSLSHVQGLFFGMSRVCVFLVSFACLRSLLLVSFACSKSLLHVSFVSFACREFLLYV